MRTPSADFDVADVFVHETDGFLDVTAFKRRNDARVVRTRLRGVVL